MLPYQKVQRWRDEHAYNEPATLQEQEGYRPPSMLKHKKICTSCELEARGNDWHNFRDEERNDNTNYMSATNITNK
eukprot:2190594-Prorocentrum_lima.AAC.1